ncbi:hypothetical protein EVA_12407 [gut metagenome]|uniref:Uncharacterized protein n=1 Tax=gut metagenome TaxID=749906 RepID=J9FY53_9ZZZZ
MSAIRSRLILRQRKSAAAPMTCCVIRSLIWSLLCRMRPALRT